MLTKQESNRCFFKLINIDYSELPFTFCEQVSFNPSHNETLLLIMAVDF